MELWRHFYMQLEEENNQIAITSANSENWKKQELYS